MRDDTDTVYDPFEIFKQSLKNDGDNNEKDAKWSRHSNSKCELNENEQIYQENDSRIKCEYIDDDQIYNFQITKAKSRTLNKEEKYCTQQDSMIESEIFIGIGDERDECFRRNHSHETKTQNYKLESFHDNKKLLKEEAGKREKHETLNTLLDKKETNLNQSLKSHVLNQHVEAAYLPPCQCPPKQKSQTTSKKKETEIKEHRYTYNNSEESHNDEINEKTAIKNPRAKGDKAMTRKEKVIKKQHPENNEFYKSFESKEYTYKNASECDIKSLINKRHETNKKLMDDTKTETQREMKSDYEMKSGNEMKRIETNKYLDDSEHKKTQEENKRYTQQENGNELKEKECICNCHMKGNIRNECSYGKDEQYNRYDYREKQDKTKAVKYTDNKQERNKDFKDKDGTSTDYKKETKDNSVQTSYSKESNARSFKDSSRTSGQTKDPLKLHTNANNNCITTKKPIVPPCKAPPHENHASKQELENHEQSENKVKTQTHIPFKRTILTINSNTTKRTSTKCINRNGHDTNNEDSGIKRRKRRDTRPYPTESLQNPRAKSNNRSTSQTGENLYTTGISKNESTFPTTEAIIHNNVNPSDTVINGGLAQIWKNKVSRTENVKNNWNKQCIPHSDIDDIQTLSISYIDDETSNEPSNDIIKETERVNADCSENKDIEDNNNIFRYNKDVIIEMYDSDEHTEEIVVDDFEQKEEIDIIDRISRQRQYKEGLQTMNTKNGANSERYNVENKMDDYDKIYGKNVEGGIERSDDEDVKSDDEEDNDISGCNSRLNNERKGGENHNNNDNENVEDDSEYDYEDSDDDEENDYDKDDYDDDDDKDDGEDESDDDDEKDEDDDKDDDDDDDDDDDEEEEGNKEDEQGDEEEEGENEHMIENGNTKKRKVFTGTRKGINYEYTEKDAMVHIDVTKTPTHMNTKLATGNSGSSSTPLTTQKTEQTYTQETCITEMSSIDTCDSLYLQNTVSGLEWSDNPFTSNSDLQIDKHTSKINVRDNMCTGDKPKSVMIEQSGEQDKKDEIIKKNIPNGLVPSETNSSSDSMYGATYEEKKIMTLNENQNGNDTSISGDSIYGANYEDNRVNDMKETSETRTTPSKNTFGLEHRDDIEHRFTSNVHPNVKQNTRNNSNIDFLSALEKSEIHHEECETQNSKLTSNRPKNICGRRKKTIVKDFNLQTSERVLRSQVKENIKNKTKKDVRDQKQRKLFECGVQSRKENR